jgi:hypothetical protein
LNVIWDRRNNVGSVVDKCGRLGMFVVLVDSKGWCIVESSSLSCCSFVLFFSFFRFFLRLMKTIKRINPIPIKSAIIPTTTPTTTEFQSNIQKQKLIEY